MPLSSVVVVLGWDPLGLGTGVFPKRPENFPKWFRVAVGCFALSFFGHVFGSHAPFLQCGPVFFALGLLSQVTNGSSKIWRHESEGRGGGRHRKSTVLFWWKSPGPGSGAVEEGEKAVSPSSVGSVLCYSHPYLVRFFAASFPD